MFFFLIILDLLSQKWLQYKYYIIDFIDTPKKPTGQRKQEMDTQKYYTKKT